MHVSAYTRSVNGHTVEVSSHDRRDRPKTATAGTTSGHGRSGTGGKAGGATGQRGVSASGTSNSSIPATTKTTTSGTDLREANPDSRLHTDLAAPPPFVKDMLKANPPQTWEKMVLALEDSGLGPNRVFAYANVFAAEGGILRDPKGTASSGILWETMKQAQKAAPPGSQLKDVEQPVDLTLEQRVVVYDHYFDQALTHVGGAIALDEIPDKQVATAVADTLFRHGPNGGPFILQQAINTVRWDNGLAGIGLSKVFDDQTLTSLVLLSSPATKAEFLKTIAGFRKNRLLPSEFVRANYFSTWQ